MEFIETSRTSNGTASGSGNMSSINIGGHLILPKGTTLCRTRRAELERQARERLDEHGIDR